MYRLFLALAVLGGPVAAFSAPDDAPGAAPEHGRMDRPDRVGPPRMLEVLRRHDPERHRKVVEVAKARPALVRELLSGSGMLIGLRDDSAEGRRQVEQTLDAIYVLHERLTVFEAATGTARAAASEQVEVAVAQLFDLRQQARRAHLEHLEERLERLRQEIAEREEARDELVEGFTARITGAPSGL